MYYKATHITEIHRVSIAPFLVFWQIREILADKLEVWIMGMIWMKQNDELIRNALGVVEACRNRSCQHR